ncbi:hypothetical protein [Rhizobium rhizoryzae]|uniref:hypothetical protein n=1 Tax=Rhizobium rhizoryzae TaxID=451876 RepID=UPI00289E3247|nr:hypothetical protein [Rhizobium rhizoryzae]
MRILPFPTKNARKPAPQIADWSQQEIADFYRAHRLLADNGAAIGIDRGLSDIGEPWLVFFDQTSQDVFLHVARIDDRCHLICDPLNLRISAANIAALIMEFEAAVRTSLSIRSERAKNVVIHPAARIIMSISAIFLLFKLENSEAQAKGLADKVSVTSDATGPARLIDKSSAAFARAQNAFARAFDSVDAPANAALLAGVILAGELATTLDANTKILATETEKTVVLPHAEDAPALQLLEGSEQHKMLVPQTETAVHMQTSAREQQVTEVLQATKSNGETAHALTQPQQVILKEAAPVVSSPLIEPHSAVHAEVSNQDVVIKTSETMARTAETDGETAIPVPSSNGLRALADEGIKTGGILFGEPKAQAPVAVATPVPTPQPEVKIKTVVSLETLSDVSSKAGFNMTTSYDDAKTYKLKEYLTSQMGGQFTFEYQSGKLLIEQTDIESSKSADIGVWTNVSADHSTMSIVGKAALIDDVLTFFS